MSRKLLPLAVLGLTALTPGLSLGDAVPLRAQGHPCGPETAKTVAANRSMRIYRPRGLEVVDVCLKDLRPRRLGPKYVENNYGARMPYRTPFVLATPWAAGFEIRQVGLDTAQVFSAAVNARSAKARNCLVGGGDNPGALPEVRRALLGPFGKLVWVADVQSRKHRQLAVCEGDEMRLLDEGDGIEPSSLHLVGSTLEWSDGGQQESAEL